MNLNLAIYIAVMAVVTYIIRATPILIFRKKIESVYVQSFLFYVANLSLFAYFPSFQ